MLFHAGSTIAMASTRAGKFLTANEGGLLPAAGDVRGAPALRSVPRLCGRALRRHAKFRRPRSPCAAGAPPARKLPLRTGALLLTGIRSLRRRGPARGHPCRLRRPRRIRSPAVAARHVRSSGLFGRGKACWLCRRGATRAAAIAAYVDALPRASGAGHGCDAWPGVHALDDREFEITTTCDGW